MYSPSKTMEYTENKEVAATSPCGLLVADGHAGNSRLRNLAIACGRLCRVVGLTAVVLMTICSCNSHATTQLHSDGEKKEIKALISRVHKSDSLDYYIAYYTERGDHYALSMAYNTRGRDFRNKANYTEALKAHEKALEHAVLAADTVEIIQAYNNLGTDYRRMGQAKDASLHHYEALRQCEQYSDKESYTAIKNRVVSLNGIGNVHLSMDDLKVAEEAFREALEGETILGSYLGMAINYANLGSILESREQYDSAWVYYHQSMESNVKAKSTLGISLCHDHFGRLHERDGDYEQALDEYMQAYVLMRDNDDLWHAMRAGLSIARVYMIQGDRGRAYPYLQEGIAMAQDTKSWGRMAEAYHMMAAYEEQGGSYREALRLYRLSQAYSDSVYNENSQRQVRDSYVGYEKEKSMLQVETIRSAYEEEQRSRRRATALAMIITVCALAVIGLLWYVLRTRRANIRMLKRMERMRTTFFTNITHEFRTPLTVILGLSEEMQGKCQDAQQQQYLDSIQRQGKSLLGLVNQLLDITRLAAGANEVAWCKGDIVAYLKRTVDGYTDYARLRKVNLTFHAQKTELDICFVPEYMDKIVRNLVANALKYTPEEGYVAVVLTLENGQAVMRVTDTGKGFPKEDLPHVFELFYQGSNNKEGSFVGTGVGLPFVKQMMEQMNGSVEARNRKEGGAELVLTLPLKQMPEIPRQCTEWREQEIVETIPDAPQEEKAEQGETIHERPVVLVVEDNDDIVCYITTLLEQRYEVRKAANGYEALLDAEEMHPDLIVTDLMMPEMDGYELCNRVRNSELICHVPIVVVSARGEDEDRIRALENGADAYLQKPFNAEELMVRVEKLIEQRKMLQERAVRMLSGNVNADTSLSDEDRKFMNRLNALIRDNIGNKHFGVEALAEKLNCSSSRLYRRIRAITGYSTQSYILRLRMERAKELLESTTRSVSDVALHCGFDDTSYFTRTFRNFYGCTPSQTR